MTEGLIITSCAGPSPLNVHGTMDGFPFFMRATQHGWTLTVVPTEQDAFEAWISAHMDGHELGIYHDAELHDCKGVKQADIMAILEGTYEKFCQMLSEDERAPALCRIRQPPPLQFDRRPACAVCWQQAQGFN